MSKATASIPESHKDLLTEPVVVCLATTMPDGQPQVTPVWADWDGTHVIFNTIRGQQKDRNLRERPKVTILAMDPHNPYRRIEVRGEVDRISEDDGVAWIDRLARKYLGVSAFYGEAVPLERKDQETRVTYRIRPTHVNVGG